MEENSNMSGGGAVHTTETTVAVGRAEAVKAIKAILRAQERRNLSDNRKVGELVDGAVGPAARATYGEDEIGALAREVGCSYERLRKCWHFHRLMLEHGQMLTSEFPQLSYSHLYQLSRLLKLEDKFEAEVIAKAIHAMAQHAMTNGKDGKPMISDDLGKAVATHIKSIRGCGSRVTNNQQDESKNPDQPDASTSMEGVYVALSMSLNDVQKSAEKIIGSGEYRNASRLQTDIERIAQAHADILGHITRNDPQSYIIPYARRRIIALAALVGLTVVDSNDSGHQGVSP